MRRINFVIILIVMLIGQAIGQTNEENYVIRKGDVLSIAVMGHPEFSIERIIVLPDGYVQLPGLGSVLAANMTIKQFTKIVTDNVGRFVLNPIVTVFISDLPNQVINVTGFVNRPGQVPVFEKISVMDAVNRAGGIKLMHKSKYIVIIRKDQTYEKVKISDLITDDVAKRNAVRLLEAGDTVYVIEPKELNWSKLSFFASISYVVLSITRLF